MFPGFYVFDKFISSYALCVLAGAAVSVPIAIRRYKRRGGDDISMIFVFLFAAIGAFFGMHLLYGITNLEHWGILLKAESLADFAGRFATLFGGSVFYGGLLGGALAGGISIRVQKLPAGLTADCIAPSAALFHAFGRVGCFLVGCCYGVEWEHGITFTESLVESANGVPRLPVQLIEVGLELVLFAVLSALLHKNKLHGGLFAVYLASYSVGRFVIEFWRGDDYRGFFLGLSTSQIVSVLVLVGAVVFLVLRRRGNRRGTAESV